MKETLERLESIHAKISDYAEVLDKELLKLYTAQLEGNLSLLKEEIKIELIKAEMRGIVGDKVMEEINSSNK